MSLGSSNLRAVQGIYHLKCTGHLYREKLVLKEVFNFFKLTLGIWIFISANINFSILLRGELVLYFTFVFCYSATSCFILASESRTQWTDFLVLEVQLQCQEGKLEKKYCERSKGRTPSFAFTCAPGPVLMTTWHRAPATSASTAEKRP